MRIIVSFILSNFINVIGVDLAFCVAEKCIRDKNRMIKLSEEPLAWSTFHCPANNVYMMTTTFLLKLHLCEVKYFQYKL